jgi:ATP-dependent DNA helicase PIF1
MAETYHEASDTDGGAEPAVHLCGTKRNYAELGTVSCPLEIDDDDDSNVCVSSCLPAKPEDNKVEKETDPRYLAVTTQNSYGSLRKLHNPYSSSRTSRVTPSSASKPPISDPPNSEDDENDTDVGPSPLMARSLYGTSSSFNTVPTSRVAEQRQEIPDPSVQICGSDEDDPSTGIQKDNSNSSTSTADEAFSNGSYSSFAHRMIAEMGHIQGKGLGKENQGITSPVKAKRNGGTRPGHAPGLGYVLKLNNQQKLAVDLAKGGENVFVTGPAGTGKSVVLRAIMDFLEQKYEGRYERWAAVAPTGIAALAVGGQTIHRLAGCGIPNVAADFNKAWQPNKRKAWRDLEVLVIEEVSMISGEFFDRLSEVVCDIRAEKDSPRYDVKGEIRDKEDELLSDAVGEIRDKNEDKPFGGIQLIVCGDFLQLPPITKKIFEIQAQKAALARFKKKDIVHCDRGFTFQARAWQQAAMTVVDLDEVYRQGNVEFVKILHEIRKGKVTADAVAFLKKCDRPLPPNKLGVKPTILYATNRDVNQENLQELQKLPSHQNRFEASDDVVVESRDYESDYGESQFDEVEYGKNEDERRRKIEKELWLSSFFQDCIAQKELLLKKGAQVMLIKNELDSGGSIDSRRSRLVNGSRGIVIGFTNKAPLPDEIFDVAAFRAEKSVPEPTEEVYPVIYFLNGRTKVVVPETFESRFPGLGSCIREAIPLKLAWAITVHKSQGMTLDYVIADVGGVFTEAQTYVALSRASDEKGLELRNFSLTKVKVSGRALAFYADPNGKFPCWDESWNKVPDQEEETGAVKSTVPSPRPGCLEGLAFVFTGEVADLPRADAEALIKACCGTVRATVSGKTNYLVIGEIFEDGRDVMSGAKYMKAEEIIAGDNKSKLRMISKSGLFELISTRKIPTKAPGITAFFKPKK